MTTRWPLRSRPPLGSARGRLWSDGTTHLLLSPLELIEKIAALVPPPRLNLVRYHGVLAPNAAGREHIVPGSCPEDAGEDAAGAPIPDAAQEQSPRPFPTILSSGRPLARVSKDPSLRRNPALSESFVGLRINSTSRTCRIRRLTTHCDSPVGEVRLLGFRIAASPLETLDFLPERPANPARSTGDTPSARAPVHRLTATGPCARGKHPLYSSYPRSVFKTEIVDVSSQPSHADTCQQFHE